MAEKDFSLDEYDKTLVYDLRQIYAVKIVGETLKQIAAARKIENFPLWFRLLKRDLRTEIMQKLNNEEATELNNKIEEVKKIINKNKEIYLGKSKDAEGYDKVEEALCSLEGSMTTLMDKEHHMYGYKEDEEGL